MDRIMRNRWSDNDHYLGPFTYAKDKYGYFEFLLGSGDWDEHRGCFLRMRAFGHTLIIALPAIIDPWHEKVYPGWDEATVKRLGRDWYWNSEDREYGFSLSEGFFNVSYGRQSHSSSTEQRKGYFLPWTQWRHVRHSYYGLKGEHIWTEPKTNWKLLSQEQHLQAHRDNWAKLESMPTVSFAFDDFDGERLVAKTRIEEMEWRFGEKWCKWLSWFRKPKIRRSLNLDFSGETGKRKGSWKGGTIGHAIDMLPGELHEEAFKRYCAEHEMTFKGAM